MTNPIARDRDARRRDAARNNAEWCDAVYRSHGRSGIFNEAIWFSRAKPIRFYANAITLAGPDRAAEQLRCIQDLVADRIQRPWAVKDSFSTLDLTALGFRVLFDAEWI
jgi:glutathione S-transferase